MTLPAGLKLGPYEVIAPLGAGGMGEVYRARDPRLNRDVALRVLPESFAADADRLRRFEQEARAAGSLNHPNIIAVHDLGSHDGATYVVSELLEGETLRGRLASGALAPRRAVDYALQIAHGLAAAHEKGIVHRDLKPENLFLTEDGRVKILDFGLAKLVLPEAEADTQTSIPTVSRGTEPGVVMGTVGYMSPEQVKGMAADARSDIFSFGAILYEMLSGRRAFRGDSAVETMSAILKEDPPDLSESNRSLPPGLERLVRHCLEKSPVQRFQSARDLAYDLEALSTASGAATTAPASASRGRMIFWPAIALLALVVGAIGGSVAVARLRPARPATYRQVTFRRGLSYPARFAPDGHTVIYSARWNGEEPRIYSVRPESPESSPLDLPPALLASVSRAGELAILLDAGESATSSSPYMTLARVPLSGGAPREVLRDVDCADWSPDGKDLAVSHRVEGQSRVEYPIGKVVYTTKGDIDDLRVSPDGRLLAVTDHPTHGDTPGLIVLIDPSGAPRTVTGGWYDVGTLVWAPDGREIWFSASKTGNRRSLWAVSLGGRVRPVAQVPGSLNVYDLSPSGEALVYSSTYRSTIVEQSLEGNSERDRSWLDFSTPIDVSSDNRTLAFEEWGEGGGANGNYSVYLRHLDGGQPVRLGEGLGLALSPDGRWILTRLYGPPPRLVLLPTGAGPVTPIPGEGILYEEWGGWLPDGKHVLFGGREANGPSRIYLQDLVGGKPRPISGEVAPGEQFNLPISPDGTLVAWRDVDGAIRLFPVDGGDARLAAGTTKGEVPIRWSSDGRTLFVGRTAGVVLKVTRVDPFSGKREAWKDLVPSDPAGVQPYNYSVVISGDGKSFFLYLPRHIGELYIASGLR